MCFLASQFHSRDSEAKKLIIKISNLNFSVKLRRKALRECVPEILDFHYKCMKLVVYFTIILSVTWILASVIYIFGPITYTSLVYFGTNETVDWPLILKVE